MHQIILGFVVAACLLMSVGVALDRSAPDHWAEMNIPSMSARLTAILHGISHLTEYQRYLTIDTPEGTLKLKMADDWGPARRTSVYEAGEGRIGILGPAGDNYFVSLRPLQRVKQVGLPSARWTYLGAFDLYSEHRSGQRRYVFRFISASEQAECIPTLLEGDEGGPHRPSFYKRRCPEFRVP